EFKYDYYTYNVVITDKLGHDTCTVTNNSQVLDSGDDHIQLQYGNNYFIDGSSTICSGGLKMAIFANSQHEKEQQQQPQL
ncbi:unnamed protein product, partial [Linum tenue]